MTSVIGHLKPTQPVAHTNRDRSPLGGPAGPQGLAEEGVYTHPRPPDVGHPRPTVYIHQVTAPQPELAVRGRALVAAVAVALVLLAAGVWAASIDLASEPERNAVPMEVLVTLFKVLSAAGLAWVGNRTNSRSMRLLALLLGLMTLGGVLVDMTWFTDAIGAVTDRLAEFVSFSSQTIELAGLFLALGVLAVVLVLAAYRATQAGEKRAVVTLLVLLAVVGVFVGPVNAIAAAGINRKWLFAEDFGQIVGMAVLTGYVAGLVVATLPGSVRLSPHHS